MNLRKRQILLILILAFVAVAAVSISIMMLYNTALKETEEMLVELVIGKATLIGSVALYDQEFNNDSTGTSKEATLRQIEDSYHDHHKFGDHRIEQVYGRIVGDSINIFLSHRNSIINFTDLYPSHTEFAKPMALALSGKAGSIIALDYNGSPVLAAYTPIEELDIGLVMKMDIVTFRAPYIREAFLASTITLVLVLFAGGLITKVTKPIINQLNHQVQQLEENKKALQESEKRFRDAFEQAAVGIAHVAPNGSWLKVNKRLCEIIDYSEDELLTLTFQDITHPDDLDKDASNVRHLLADEIQTYSMEKRYIRKDRAPIWINLSVSLVRDNLNQPEYFVSIVEDIHDRKMLEMERNRLSSELNNKNKELEQVIYVASHDLRSPLLNIQGFSEELRKCLKDLDNVVGGVSLQDDEFKQIYNLLNDDIPLAIKFIQSSSEKMDGLLTGLLTLSRTGRAPMEVKTLDMNDLIEKVIQNHQYQLREIVADIKIGKLPPCQGDATQINQVFSNLIDNAFKYRNPNRSFKITIAGEIINSYLTYTVDDNGIGIDPAHQDKIFEIFHRLEPEKSTGEGLGLTIIRRILQRHQGSISIDSALGRGSKFIIKLPVNIQLFNPYNS